MKKSYKLSILSLLTTRHSAKLDLRDVELEGGSYNHTLYPQGDGLGCTFQSPHKLLIEVAKFSGTKRDLQHQVASAHIQCKSWCNVLQVQL